MGSGISTSKSPAIRMAAGQTRSDPDRPAEGNMFQKPPGLVGGSLNHAWVFSPAAAKSSQQSRLTDQEKAGTLIGWPVVPSVSGQLPQTSCCQPADTFENISVKLPESASCRYGSSLTAAALPTADRWSRAVPGPGKIVEEESVSRPKNLAPVDVQQMRHEAHLSLFFAELRHTPKEFEQFVQASRDATTSAVPKRWGQYALKIES